MHVTRFENQLSFRKSSSSCLVPFIPKVHVKLSQPNISPTIYHYSPDRTLNFQLVASNHIKPLISDVELLSNEFFYKLKLLYQVLQSPIPHRALSLLNKDTFWFISNKSLLYLTPLPRNPFRYTLSMMCYLLASLKRFR